MLHLSFSLLLLQYCYLFILHFIIHYSCFLSFFIYHFFSSQLRYSSVNVELHFNVSLIILAPSVPILLSVHVTFIILFLFFLSFFTILFITFQIQFSQCRITFQCFTYHSHSFISNFVTCSYLYFIIYYSCFFSFFIYHSFHHNSDTV